MHDHEFQLLMGRFTKQDEVLQDIKDTVQTINGTVRRHDRDIAWAKGLGWAGLSLTTAFWGVYKFFLGGK